MTPRQAAAEAKAGQLWTRPPERPTRYRLHVRLPDMAHGWLDGKCGLPRLPELPTAEVMPRNGTLAVGAGEIPDPLPRPEAEPGPAVQLALAAPPVASAGAPVAAATPLAAAAAPPAWLRTPRMQMLCVRALELIMAEEAACIADCAVYKSELSRFRSAQDAHEAAYQDAKAMLERAQRPLSEPELSMRRLAEHDTSERPDSLVRARRQAEWERRLAAATHLTQAAAAQVAEATREAQLREELIADRIAVARAAALRHHEFHLRRIATYLQQLMRSHKQGADLNMLLMRYPVGPDLPEWTRGPAADQTERGDPAVPTK